MAVARPDMRHRLQQLAHIIAAKREEHGVHALRSQAIAHQRPLEQAEGERTRNRALRRSPRSGSGVRAQVIGQDRGLGIAGLRACNGGGRAGRRKLACRECKPRRPLQEVPIRSAEQTSDSPPGIARAPGPALSATAQGGTRPPLTTHAGLAAAVCAERCRMAIIVHRNICLLLD